MYVQKVTVGVTHLIPLQFAHCNIHQFFYFGKNEEAVPALFNKEIQVVVVICMLGFFCVFFFFLFTLGAHTLRSCIELIETVSVRSRLN